MNQIKLRSLGHSRIVVSLKSYWSWRGNTVGRGGAVSGHWSDIVDLATVLPICHSSFYLKTHDVQSVLSKSLTQSSLQLCTDYLSIQPEVDMTCQAKSSVLPWLIPGAAISLGLENRVSRIASHSLFWLLLYNMAMGCRAIGGSPKICS